MKIEYHYAPLEGELLKIIDGVEIEIHGQAEYKKLLKEFFAERNSFTFVREITYGHKLLSGHRGRVLVFVKET